MKPETWTRGTKSKKRMAIHSKSRGLCSYCGVLVPVEVGHMDHQIPKAYGGNDLGDTNLVWCCPHCNWSKKQQTVLEWVGPKQDADHICVTLASRKIQRSTERGIKDRNYERLVASVYLLTWLLR